MRERNEVRACGRADLGTVLRILAEAPEAAAWSASGLEETLQRNSGYSLVGEHQGAIVAFIVGRRMADEGEILNLAVKKQCRRQGLGRALVQRLLDIFEGEGVKGVYLEVRESNEGAIALYRGMGFEQSGRRTGYYHAPEEAALLLRANLKRKIVQEVTKTGLT